jgi:phospholipase/carboxylesterase
MQIKLPDGIDAAVATQPRRRRCRWPESSQDAHLSKITNGSSRQPSSGGAPRQIVLLLHGYGSNGEDLISLAAHWQHLLPDALFLAPNAPQRCGFGYQWWALNAFSPKALAAGAVSAAPAIDAFIDRKLEQYGLTESDLALVGFSQGTMMALHVGLRRGRQIAGILGYSGALTGAADLPSQARAKPPVLLIHGAADQVIPVAALHAAARELKQLGIDVRTHISSGLGHSVDPTGLRLGAEFLVETLKRA